MENIDVSDGFWGLTKKSVFKLRYENNVESYKPVDAPKAPKKKSGESEVDLEVEPSDAKKIQFWCRLLQATEAEQFLMILVSVNFMKNVAFSDGFLGLGFRGTNDQGHIFKDAQYKTPVM
jgi:hypothetical protein